MSRPNLRSSSSVSKATDSSHEGENTNNQHESDNKNSDYAPRGSVSGRFTVNTRSSRLNPTDQCSVPDYQPLAGETSSTSANRSRLRSVPSRVRHS